MGSFSTTHISGTSFQILSVTVIISLYWRRFESLNQQHNNFSFNKELRMMMDSTEVRAPQLWRRPHAKIYGYNQDFSANYYSPMLEYVHAKNRQGIFFTKPVEKIHLPDGGELGMRKPEERIETAASPFDLDTFLVRSFSQQIKEVNK